MPYHSARVSRRRLIGKVDYARTMRPLLPFFSILLLGLLAIALFPAITLLLPRLIGGYEG